MVKVCCRKCWLQFKKYIYCVIYYNFWQTFVPYSRLWPDGVVESVHYCRRFGDLSRWFLRLRLYAECSPYFYCRFVWPTDLESIPHESTPTSIIPTEFEVDITIHCRVVAFLSAHTSRDLVTLTFVWPFDLEQLTCMVGHVTNRATKFEDPTTIHSWVTSHNVSRWLPLKMRTRPLRMRRITWPVTRGSKTITFLESPTLICLFTIQFLLGYDDD